MTKEVKNFRTTFPQRTSCVRGAGLHVGLLFLKLILVTLAMQAIFAYILYKMGVGGWGSGDSEATPNLFLKPLSCAGLPEGLFSNKKSQFG
jgi:hypothetical protein